MKLSPLIKGLITGVLMVLTHLLLFYKKVPADSPYTYLVYALYAAGLLWTIMSYSASAEYKPEFGPIFSQGFRCFIVVTLVMVSYIFIFIKMHPQMVEDMAQAYRTSLVEQGSKSHKTPEQITEAVKEYKDNFTASYISVTMFGHLVMGVIFTAAAAGFLLMRRK